MVNLAHPCIYEQRYLDTLVRVCHHSNEEINKHNHGYQHVNPEYEFEQYFGPEGLIVLSSLPILSFELIGRGLAENREKQQLESLDGVLLDWNHKPHTILIT